MAAKPTFQGISFPYRKGSESFPEGSTDSALIRQSIIQILLTEPGERLMMPTFGSGLTARVFDNNDAMFESLIQAEVYSAVGRWEPRAIIRGVDVVREDSTVTVTVGYVVIATQQPDSVELVLSTPQ